MRHKIICGHVLDVLKTMPDESVDTIVTSPPYWGLRSYLPDDHPDKEKEIGLEPTLDLYLDHLLEVMRELKRVLKKTGTIWWNHGDNYGTSGSYSTRASMGAPTTDVGLFGGGRRVRNRDIVPVDKAIPPKCMALQNYRFILRCVDELGLILRNVIIWHKCLGSNVPIYAKSNGKIIRTRVKDLAKLPLDNLYLPTPDGWKRIVRIEKQPLGDLLTVHLRNGVAIEVTPEHRFLVNGKLIEARYLAKGMVIEHGRLSDEKGTQLGNYENGWIVGFWLAEGNYEHEREAIRFSIHKDETEYANKIRVWGEKYAGKFRKHTYDNYSAVIVNGAVPIAIIRHYTSRSGAKHKRLSSNAFSESNEFLRGILDGFLAGDGYWDEKNNRWRFRITANRDLIDDLRVICNRLEYFMRARLRHGKGFGKEHLIFDIEIRRTRTGHFNQKDDYEIMRIEKTKGISYEIEIEDPHVFILPDGTLTHNSNHMPSSVKDRFTNAYEPVFMLVKSKKYYFDLDAVRVPHKYPNLSENNKRPFRSGLGQEQRERGGQHPLGKNPGDVWAIPTQPFPEAHFATFGEKLIAPMIKAGCPQWICRACGKPRERIVKITINEDKVPDKWKKTYRGEVELPNSPTQRSVSELYKEALSKERYTVGWTDCGCGAGWESCVVLDPFAGSGTVGVVAERLGRNSILIDINKEYCEMALRRLKPLVAQKKLTGEESIIETEGF